MRRIVFCFQNTSNGYSFDCVPFYSAWPTGDRMLKSLHVENFKGIKEFDIQFERINLLVGGNNSGKTTLFHALQFFFWAFDQIAAPTGSGYVLRKTQTTEIPVVPYAEVKDLLYLQRMRDGAYPTHVKIRIEAENVKPITIEMYQAFSRNVMIAGNDLALSEAEYNAVQRINPVYVPSSIGITAQEDYYRPIALNSMVRQGRQNQVLRNLVYQV